MDKGKIKNGSDLKEDPNASKKAEIYTKINQLINKIQTYPVITKKEEMEKAVNEIVKIYKKSTDEVKQPILYTLHNLLFEINDIVLPQSENAIRKRENIQDQKRLRIEVYRRMFNQNTSLEGIHTIIEILIEIGDEAAAKVLTHFLSHLMMVEAEGYRMLRVDVINALGRMKTRYAIDVLLYYAKVVNADYLRDVIRQSLEEWRSRMQHIGKREKERIINEIEEILGKNKEAPETQYR